MLHTVRVLEARAVCWPSPTPCCSFLSAVQLLNVGGRGRRRGKGRGMGLEWAGTS